MVVTLNHSHTIRFLLIVYLNKNLYSNIDIVKFKDEDYI